MPPEEFWPEDTQVAGHVAVENKFLDCDDDECDVDISSAEVPLQRMTISIPSVHMLGALTFVLHSKDHTMWYKDAADNFLVPLPFYHMLGALTFVLRSKDHTMWYKGEADNFLTICLEPSPSCFAPRITRCDRMLGALTFMLRSKDHTMWYKDTAGNFLVPHYHHLWLFASH
eukprot:gene29013-32204_t